MKYFNNKSMKTSIKNMAMIIMLSFAIISNESCKKSEPNITPTPYGSFYFHIHTGIGGAEVDTSTIGIDSLGRRFKMSLGQFYINNIILKKADGTTFPIKSTVYLLKKMSNETYYLDSVPAGNYSSITFDVGVDDVSNHVNPANFASSSPLYIQNPSMWFGSTSSGYMFMNVQGMADTSANNNGTVNFPFTLQLGTSSDLRTVNMPNTPFTITAKIDNYYHMMADYGKLFQGVSFMAFNANNNYTVSPFTSPSAATQIADNIANMFKPL
ncbi:MAG: MbnP family protein [Bacteroidota bacterium]